jgi:hypothetical protein
MGQRRALKTRILTLAICLAFGASALAGEVLSLSSEKPVLTPGNDAPAYTIRVIYPDGRKSERLVLAGEHLTIDPAGPGDVLASGLYVYEIIPIVGDRNRADHPDLTEKSATPAPAPSITGTFRVIDEQVYAASLDNRQEATQVLRKVEDRDDDGTPGTMDQVIHDDLIVIGSACVGFDCVNNESFGFDTIRLKENNLRIGFDDTSTAAGFPANDWEITINDSASGGANYFAVRDVTAARQVFRIDAGAPTHALVVSSSGRIGVRTLTPVLDMHMVSSNTPAIRLEQTGAGGWTPQTWDIAGNEANFFIRDVTGGSRLPFRIRPGAPTSSIDISSGGDVGMGGVPLSFANFRNLTIRGGSSGSTYEHADAAGNRKAFWVYNASGSVSFGTLAGAGPIILNPEGGTGNVGIGASPTTKLDINGNTLRLRNSRTPASATETCNQGEITWSNDHVYVCVAANTWKRSALSTW